MQSKWCFVRWLYVQMIDVWGTSLGGLDSTWFDSANRPILRLWFGSVDRLVKLILWEFPVGSFRGSGPCVSGSWCSVPVPFLFHSCSWGSGRVLVRVRFVFLFLVLGVLVLGVLVCSYSVLVPVLVRSCSVSVPFLVRVPVLFWFWSCSWFCSGSGPVRGSCSVPGGSVRSLGFWFWSCSWSCSWSFSVLGPLDIFEFLLRKKGWLVLI